MPFCCDRIAICFPPQRYILHRRLLDATAFCFGMSFKKIENIVYLIEAMTAKKNHFCADTLNYSYSILFETQNLWTMRLSKRETLRYFQRSLSFAINARLTVIYNYYNWSCVLKTKNKKQHAKYLLEWVIFILCLFTSCSNYCIFGTSRIQFCLLNTSSAYTFFNIKTFNAIIIINTVLYIIHITQVP